VGSGWPKGQPFRGRDGRSGQVPLVSRGDILVSIAELSDSAVLSISDDGPGLPAKPDPKNGKGLGMRLIRSLTKQIGDTST
jgi:two-component sensor histidine kinase